MEKPRILVVEDDPDIQELLVYTLEREGFIVTQVTSSEDGLASIKRQKPDLIILDIMLPGMTGLDMLKKIKAEPELVRIKVIMASAKGEDPDVVLGLELGADDYVVKPYSPRVLVARIRRHLRDTTTVVTTDKDTNEPSSGPFRLVTPRHEAWVGNKPVDLSATEYDLLELFVRNPGIVFSRDRIIAATRGADHAITDRAVDVQILGLRKKLGEAGDSIETVRGVGYRLRDGT